MRKRIVVVYTVKDPDPPEVLRQALVQLTAEHLRRWTDRRKGERP